MVVCAALLVVSVQHDPSTAAPATRPVPGAVVVVSDTTSPPLVFAAARLKQALNDCGVGVAERPGPGVATVHLAVAGPGIAPRMTAHGCTEPSVLSRK